MLSVNTENILKSAHPETLKEIDVELLSAFHTLIERKGAGNEYTGWIDLPAKTSGESLDQILRVAKSSAKISQAVVVIGIGGSYLGSKAIINALSNHFHNLISSDGFPHIIFAGHNLSSKYHADLLGILQDIDYSIIVISKSGTTTEPAIAFRLLKKHLEDKYGVSQSKKRVITITDKEHGALRKMTDKTGYSSFHVPNDIGGRYSVLTPVGLVPLATAGINIKELISGAAAMREIVLNDRENNPASLYAKARIAMYRSGKPLEVMVNYEPGLITLAEWWKQLFGESEGKNGKGIFPAAVSNTTDLHSMGQYIQDGLRVLFETVISVETLASDVYIPYDTDNTDNLNYIAGRDLSEVNKIAEEATRQAHIEGGVPNIRITIPEITPYYLGQIIYMFEFACALSAYMIGVNPFDQPGVEAYKSKMFELLGKPSV